MSTLKRKERPDPPLKDFFPLRTGGQLCTLFFKDFIYLFMYLFLKRGDRREKEMERNISERETLISCLLYAPQPGTKPTTLACALTLNQTGDLSPCWMMLNELSPSGQGTTLHSYLLCLVLVEISFSVSSVLMNFVFYKVPSHYSYVSIIILKTLEGILS